MSELDAKLIPEPPLLVLPSLATSVGLNEAIALQQIHYRARESADGWWRASVPQLRAEFPFWSENTIKRTFAKLRREGLVAVRQGGTDRTNQYQVQYDPVHRLSSAPKRPDASAQSAPVSYLSSKREGNGKRGDAPARNSSRFDRGTR